MIPILNAPLSRASTDVFASESSDIVISNSVATVSLTSVSAANTTEKFVIPSTWLDKIGSGVTLDLIISHKNNEGTSRALTLSLLIGATTVLSGTTPAISTGATSRSVLIRARVRRIGATTALAVLEIQIGNAGGSGSGTPVGSLLAMTSGRCHNEAAPMPAVGNAVTLAVTASLAAASTELTLNVNRRRLYVW